MTTNQYKTAILAIVAAGITVDAMGDFVWDNFESYLVGTNLSALSARGWGASSTSVIVTNDVFGNPTNQVELPPAASASNLVNRSGVSGKVWSECLIAESVRMDPTYPPDVNSGAMVMVSVTTSGVAIVYNSASNGWDICSNDCRGTPVTGLASGTWARVTVCQDFDSHRVAVFLNGHLMRQKFQFISNRTDYAGIRLARDHGTTPGYFDDVYVSNAIPPALMTLPLSSTNDINGDGVLDAVEIMQYGMIAKVVPCDSLTITGALATVEAGNRVVVSNGVYAGSVVLSNGVTLVGTNMSGTAPTLKVDGDLTAGTGTVLTASGGLTVTGQVNVLAGGVLTISNTAATFANLVIQSGGFLQVNNSTLTANGITLSGTFTLDSGWSGNLTRSVPDYSNDFETYPLGIPLSRCGGQGWWASGSADVIQGAVTNTSPKAAVVMGNTLISNSVAATGLTRIWTDFYLNDSSIRSEQVSYPDLASNRVTVLFVNTNNAVTVWNAGRWDECVANIGGTPCPTVTSGQWVRVTLFTDFTPPGTVALFLNGQLVRQQLPLASPLAAYSGFGVSAGSGAAYLDDVNIWTNVPPGLTNGVASDLDGDGFPDALELQKNGSTTLYPRGSVFKIR